ncbi:MAG: glycosyl hydrolase, partial [Bacteroidota bacterium]
MKITAIIILLASSLVALSVQDSANFGAAKFAPEDGKKLLIIGQDLGFVGGLNTYTNGYVDQFSSHVPAGVTSYTSIPSLGGLTNRANWGAGDVQAQAYLNDPTFNHSFIVIGLYLVGVLEGINDGDHDQSIQTLANWIKGQNRPVFIRIGYEFEGPWNAYAPNAFRDAWRHIVHIFDEEEVRNVAYVWQSAGLNYSNILDWYPGDEYVNWLGYSQFDGQNMGQSIKSLAIQRNKPIMIAEATPRVDLGDGNGQAHW